MYVSVIGTLHRCGSYVTLDLNGANFRFAGFFRTCALLDLLMGHFFFFGDFAQFVPYSLSFLNKHLMVIFQTARKSALLSSAKKAKLKTNPSRVRFAEGIVINGSPLFPVSIPICENLIEVSFLPLFDSLNPIKVESISTVAARNFLHLLNMPLNFYMFRGN